MAARRTYGSYNDGCASAHGLDLIGERWALIVVRELLLGPKRFVDLQRDVPGIGPAVLTQRLQDLEEVGVVTRHTSSAPTHVMLYDLTDWGRELEAVNTALSLWAVRSPLLPIDADMSPDTLILAMRAHARPLVPGDHARVVSLQLQDSRLPDRAPVEYLAEVAGEGASITKSVAPDNVDARVASTTRAWKGLVIGGAPLDTSEDTAVQGDKDAVLALLEATRL